MRVVRRLRPRRSARGSRQKYITLARSPLSAIYDAVIFRKLHAGNSCSRIYYLLRPTRAINPVFQPPSSTVRSRLSWCGRNFIFLLRCIASLSTAFWNCENAAQTVLTAVFVSCCGCVRRESDSWQGHTHLHATTTRHAPAVRWRQSIPICYDPR